MTFNSMIFIWLVLPLILTIYYLLLNNTLRNIFLVLVSLFMYAWGSIETIGILLLSILSNYLFGMLIGKVKNKKIPLALGIVFNCLMLGYFKYYNFFAENINVLFKVWSLPVIELMLPLGVSYFTFSAISYLVDVYREDVKWQKNPLNIALYISFFPKMLMGPIEAYKSFETYIYKKDISLETVAGGSKKFIYGLAKKVIIANSMAVIADRIFNSDYTYLTTSVAWFGAICYMIQIYFDFSGYSDMAIGVARMLGFNLNENFDLPYSSCSITEFWRRWHISLSSWFKNYLYIPLGGNRKGKFRTYLNLFIVFFTTGIWHGASWNFIVWGLFNGLFMIIERIFLKNLLDKNKFKLLNRIYTLFVVLVAWVLFRTTSLNGAFEYLTKMFTSSSIALKDSIYLSDLLTMSNVIIFITSIFLFGLIPSFLRKFKKIKTGYEVFIEPIILITLFLICIMYIVNGTYNSFIYMNF